MFGYIACVLVTCAYLPQAWLTYKSGQCPLSWGTLLVLMVGMLLWSIHAINQPKVDVALLCSSILSFMQLMFLSLYKIREKDDTVK